MKWKISAVVAFVLLFTFSVNGFAKMIAPAPLAYRVALADSIVIGKVIGLEEKKVKGSRYPGDSEGAEFVIATVKIESAFGNITDLKRVETVRVGFLPPPMPVNPGPGGIRPGIRRQPGPQLAKDQQVCLFLTPQPKANFYYLQSYTDVIVKNEEASEMFVSDTATVKKLAKLLEDPKAGLESKDHNDRFLTAAMLIRRLRDRRGLTGQVTEAPIDPVQSKLILKGLAGADWSDQPKPGQFQLTPLNVLLSLNLTDKDGWKTPENGQNLVELAQNWLKTHGDTFQVKRLVESNKTTKD